MQSLELIQDYPSNIAAFLLTGKIDIGLVPVAILPLLKQYHIHTNYCIGCDGPVASVCLFSEVPIGQIRTVLMDYQSRTSVALLKILMSDYWKISPDLSDTSTDYGSFIKGTTAGLLIGDRSLGQRRTSEYVYDLGEAWKQFTGLPFVFAAWVSVQPMDPSFIDSFNGANKFGLEKMDEVIESYATDLFDMREYFTKYISYEFNAGKKKGLNRFLELLDVDRPA